MKGRKQGECSGCGRGKGSHDSNAGWYEMGPRRLSGYHLQHLFCPACAAALLVGLDARMGEGKRNPNLVAVLRGDLERAVSLLERVSFREQGVVLQREHHAIVEHFSAMLGRRAWSTLTRFIQRVGSSEQTAQGEEAERLDDGEAAMTPHPESMR